MNIHLVTNITGFPGGTAAAKRIRMIGKALIEAGCSFTVYTNSLSYDPFNTQTSGKFEGILFKYLHKTTNLKVGKLKKILLYIKGIIALHGALRKMNAKNDIVYIDAQGNMFNVIAILLCKLYRLKIFEEVNEWFHNELNRPLEKIINEGPMLKWVDGALVISQHINNAVLKINPKLKTIVIPVLEDPCNYLVKPTIPAVQRFCFWMGMVDGYLHDILFIIEALALAHQRGESFDLVISGPCKYDATKEKIKSKAEAVGYPIEKIKLLGYVSEEELSNYCETAFFFIVPLWQNERSASRFPTKIASFMFSGKPVLTCNVGESGAMLTDKKNILFYKAGDAKDLVDKIELITTDINLYNSLCINTKNFAMDNFNYKRYSIPLQQFCKSVAEG